MQKLMGHTKVGHTADLQGKSPQQIPQLFPRYLLITGPYDFQGYASLHKFTPNYPVSAFRLSGLTGLPELLASVQDEKHPALLPFGKAHEPKGMAAFSIERIARVAGNPNSNFISGPLFK